MTDITPAYGIDYRNVEEVCAYGLLLGKIYECRGGYNLPAKATREIRQQCLVWLREVKVLINSILMGSASYANLGDIPRLLPSYDFLYRIGHGAPCHDYQREVKLRTADRWAKGDRSITQTDVALLLLSEIDRNICGIEERYAEFAIGEMSTWVEELMKHGGFNDIPPAETYQRLAYLLNADLTAYMGRRKEANVKARWVTAYMLTEDQVDTADTDTLLSYANFIETIPFGTPQEHEHNYSTFMQILTKIASCFDTHPYLVKTIELTFARRATLIA